jgi:MoxR-like ATPase
MAGMKSALELAMEKINAQKAQEETVVSLTDAQRQEISDLRKQYDAKIAEKEIMLQADIRQLIQRRPPQEAMAAAQELREQFQLTKKALQEEMEAKIAAVRTRA